MWDELGFSESPYAATALPSSEQGERLLVGREPQLKQLLTSLTYSNRHPTVEGDNGVGKTSLVAIAGYRARQARVTGQRSQFFLPLERTFQLSPEDTVDGFRRQVFFEIARAFITEHTALKDARLVVPDSDEIDRWLNSPILHGTGGGISVLGSGGSGQRSSQPNTGAGFTEAGFLATVDRWLRDCFPSALAGGFICVIDNLELLETSQAARAQLERLRDALLNQKGLRWVLCGAKGIVRSAASSARLEGLLADPINLVPISDDDVADVVGRRIEVFSTRPDAYAPVEASGFRYLYEVLHKNLRNALRYAEEFSMAVVLSGDLVTEDAKMGALQGWLRGEADKHHQDTHGVGKRAWEVFDGLVVLDGECSPGDFELFSFNNAPSMRPHVQMLEEANLVGRVIDETDNRRKTISLTPRGWLVHYRRNDYQID
ncbi:MAG TPA: hypothetical protein VGO80_19645 [Solirubrobacteraceae bacterium]|jgi:hypothetical protein|nr:hypothetical protein [Solirubrobacteraceae bacterium]